MTMEVDFRTPGTSSNATGQTDADGDGFNVELGYAYKLKSGLTLAPQLQYASVDVDLDDFASSDGVYASPSWAASPRCCAPDCLGLQDLRDDQMARSRRWPT